MEHFKTTDDYKICLEIQTKNRSNGNPLEHSEDGFITYHEGYGNDVRGTYVPFRCFQLVALWADKRHKLEVLELLESINNKANETHISAYDEMKRLNNQLQEEINELKKQREEDLVKLTDLTTPINKLNKSTIYASPVGKTHFQLRFSTVTPSKSVKMIKSVQLTNAKDVKEQTMEKLTQEGLVEKVNHKNVISTEQVEHCFDTINNVKENKSEIISIEERNVWINNEISKLKQRPQNSKVIGKIFELEQILLTPDLIPWARVPQSILNKYNEIGKDTGIDAVKIENDEIVSGFQYKLHNGTYITKKEVNQFINKLISIPKKLILKNCKVSKNIRKQLSDQNVEINYI